MAVCKAAPSIFSLSSLNPSSSSNFRFPPKSSPSIVHLSISTSTPSLSINPLSSPRRSLQRRLCIALCSTVQEEATLEVETEEIQQPNAKKKLFVFNLPWSLTVVDIKELFGQCGTVADVEIIKQKNGRSRGFAFVTMSSGEEAKSVVDKFDSLEVSGRIIRVDFAKNLKKPSPPPPQDLPATETRYQIYVSNLAWKARSTHLREFFSVDFNPVSARVVFNTPGGKASGYGFVSFATKEEADAAISALEGKELMGRTVRLKFNDKNADEPQSEKEKEKESENESESEKVSEVQPEE